jgi:hypothetical protein
MGRSKQVTDAQARGVSAFGREGGGLSKSRRQRFAEAEHDSDRSDERKTEQGATNSRAPEC